ncbi:hypothetical protein, unknown function [Leishmania tarentolae]|uniref:Amastin-like protein n=1 Tax=Leishmania tarentolae TaxID=5689 RepID=A0A640KAW7_LEITA|nr:hypothetical protein, unknown function [Leishmania tarentolae]
MSYRARQSEVWKETPQEERAAASRSEEPQQAMESRASNNGGAPMTESDLQCDFDKQMLEVKHDKRLTRKERAAQRKSLLERQAAVEQERERRAIAALESRLPRPDWYSSADEDEMIEDDIEEKKVSELKTQPEGGAGFVFCVLYTVLSAIAFVFHLASSCPIPWMRSKSGRKYGVWRATGGGLPDLKVGDIHDCSYEMQYWQATAATTVMATVASCGSMISGVLLCVNKGHMGASFILSFYSFFFSLVSWALVVALYHFSRCGKAAFASGVAHLDAGFALTLIGWVMHMGALIVLGVHFFKYWTRSINSGKTRAVRFLYVAAGVITIFLYCSGQAYSMWGKTFPEVEASVSLWYVRVYDRQTRLSTYLSRNTYKCPVFNDRMKASVGLLAVGTIWLFFAVVLGTCACYNFQYIKVSIFCGYASCICALVGWIVLVVTQHDHLCDGATPSGQSYWADMGYNGIPSGIENAQVEFSGYGLREGFGLILVGWILSTVVLIFNTALWDI